MAAAIGILIPLLRWGLIHAVWTGTPEDCRAPGAGACWTFVGHKLRLIIFGLYPPPEQWRALATTGVFVALIIATARPELWRRWLLGAWAVGIALGLWLLHGGLGLAPVPTRLWGGLPITLLLTAGGLAGGFPLGILLALARRSRLPVLRPAAAIFVEVVRGVPLIAVLYVAALVVPLTLPAGLEIDKLALALGAVIVFAAAYLAEAVRAGLQIIPRGQAEAAAALGLHWWQITRLVVLPQALKVAIPAFISIAVGFFQDTSLVVTIGLFDLLNTVRSAAEDPLWLGFHTEAYLFAGLLYAAGSAATSRYGLWLERRLATARPLWSRAH
jgi:general L-amino acid transport system permease protein